MSEKVGFIVAVFKVIRAESDINRTRFSQHMLNNLVFLSGEAPERVNENKSFIKIIIFGQNIAKLGEQVVGVEVTARNHCVVCVKHGDNIVQFHF